MVILNINHASLKLFSLFNQVICLLSLDFCGFYELSCFIFSLSVLVQYNASLLLNLGRVDLELLEHALYVSSLLPLLLHELILVLYYLLLAIDDILADNHAVIFVPTGLFQCMNVARRTAWMLRAYHRVRTKSRYVAEKLET